MWDELAQRWRDETLAKYVAPGHTTWLRAARQMNGRGVVVVHPWYHVWGPPCAGVRFVREHDEELAHEGGLATPEVRRLLADYDPATEMLVVVSDAGATYPTADAVYRVWMDRPPRLRRCPRCGGALYQKARVKQSGGQYKVTAFGCRDCDTISTVARRSGCWAGSGGL
jgi:hypothetical protein